MSFAAWFPISALPAESTARICTIGFGATGRNWRRELYFITGDTASAETIALLAQDGTPCVEKPFRVRELLDGGRENHRKTMKDEPRLRFLIVDDEQSIRRLCMTVGQGLNFICTEAETAEAASHWLKRRRPISWSPI